MAPAPAPQVIGKEAPAPEKMLGSAAPGPGSGSPALIARQHTRFSIGVNHSPPCTTYIAKATYPLVLTL